jgi:UDP-glucose 4-epimerase
MKVLITGGAGFIGSHLADGFIERGDQVAIFDRARQLHEFRSIYIAGDLMDREAVASAVRKSDVVIHAGGILGTHETVSNAKETARVNIVGSLNVIDAVTRYGNRLVSISKPNVWLNPYSITKDSVEKFCFMYVNECGTNIAIVKLYNVYGTRQKYSQVRKAMPTWIVAALSGRPVEIFGTGTATVDLVHTEDVKNGVIAIVDNFESCRVQRCDGIAADIYSGFPIFNKQVLELGSGQDISVNESVEALREALGISFEVRRLPMRRGEVDGTKLCADISRATSLTGFRPKVFLQEGLTETIAYYKERLPQMVAGML